jgi:hypothetical protein
MPITKRVSYQQRQPTLSRTPFLSTDSTWSLHEWLILWIIDDILGDANLAESCPAAYRVVNLFSGYQELLLSNVFIKKATLSKLK